MGRMGRRPPVEAEVDEEMEFHVEMRVRELVARGWDPEEARAEAIRRFGDLERVKDDCRTQGRRRDGRMRRQRWFDELRQDLGFAVRQLRRAPGFSAVVVVTLALAIGATSSVFSVADAVVLRPLPFPESDRLVAIWTRYLPASGFDIEKFALSGPEVLDLADTSEALEDLTVMGGGSRTLTGGGADPERLGVGFVSASFGAVLGVEPVVGRWFGPDEDVPGATPVVVLAHDLWQSRFGGDPDLVGRTVELDGGAVEVVGVMPPGFDYPSGRQAWLPMGLDRSNEGGRASHGYSVLGRLRDGVSLDAFDAELERLNAGWGAEYEHNAHHFLWAQSLKDEEVADAPRTLALLAAAVGLVLLVACANVANLLLARSERRMGEVGVRTALGADRGRIVRQLVTESLVLAGLAAVLGLALGGVGTRALLAIHPEALPRLDGVGVDGRVLGFTALLAAVTALLFGVGPALWTGRRALGSVAGGTRGSTAGRGRSFLRRGLVSAEVAFSLTVVLFAALTARSLVGLVGTDPGFTTRDAATVRVSLPTGTYSEGAQLPGAFDDLRRRLATVGGVRSVGAANGLPFAGVASRWDFVLDDRPPREEGTPAWNARVTIVTPGYLETLGIPLLRGRSFTDADGPDDAMVGMVSRSMADRTWPDADPLGKRWGYERTDSTGATVVEWITVVGVFADQFANRIGEEVVPEVYLPHAQVGISGYGWSRAMSFVVASDRPANAILPEVRAAVAAFDPDLPLYSVGTLQGLLDTSLQQPRLTANLLGSFGLLALLLAAVGLYGVVAYAVAGRTREFGVRRALGAPRGEVTRLVLAEGSGPLLVGVAVGLAVAAFGVRLVEGLLYGVEPLDPLTFLGVSALLVGVGLLASVIPALRATAVAPTEALRE